MANSPKKFQVGEMFSIHTIVRIVENPEYRGRDDWYLCRCGGCGIHNEMSTSALYSARQRNSGRCPSCPPGIAPRKQTSCGDHCPTCYDLPHRRPRSKKCRCGKRYEPDAFTATEQDAHACANLWLYASQLLGADGFAGLEDWIT
jgi:hypothetical protein